jgi:soluble lytic murein transglycosylase
MTTRRSSAVLFVAAAALLPASRAASEPDRPSLERSAVAFPAKSRFSRAPGVPEEAIRAIEQNRFFHATLLIRQYLVSVRDTTPDDLIYAARAEAGWGDWETVSKLLGSRTWLDNVAGGLGWNLLGRSFYEAGQWLPCRRALGRWLEIATDAAPAERGLAELYRGHAAREAGDAPAAIASYDRAATLLEPVRDWIALQSVGALAAAGDTAAVTARLGRIEPELAREWGWRYRLRAFRNAKDARGALAVAERVAAELTASQRRAEAWVEVARLRTDLGNPAGAREALRRALNTAPGTTAGVDAARLLSDLSGITADDQLLIGRTYLRHGNMQRGTAGLQAYLNAGKGTAAERERLRYDIANAWFGAGRYDDAERVLLGIARRGIAPSLSADARFLAARAQYRDGRVTTARQTLLDVVAKYPKQEAAAKAMYLSADLDHDDGNIERAVERYRRTTTLPADAEEVGLAWMRLGGIAYQKEDWAGARRAFDGYRGAFPNGRRYAQATYWSGLAARRMGDDSVARARFEDVLRLEPFTYYGGQAAAILGRAFWELPLRPTPAPDSTVDAEVRAALQPVDLLLSMEWTEAADYEVDRLRRRFESARSALYTLAEELNRRGYTTAGIAIGWDLFRQSGGWNDRLLRIIYPFPYQDVILAEAAERQVDPFLTAALIRQESMFNREALSRVGAVGLMQVMPATGDIIARQLGIRRFDPDMLKHAELNVHLGTRYLADQLADFDDRLPVVLAAYNAGPHRIDRWQDLPEFTDDELFAERIPFAETRDYVKIVQNNARLYEALYKPLIPAKTGER